MPSVQFVGLFQKLLEKKTALTSVSLILLLVGLQAIMDVKFSCPCKVGRNLIISTSIFFVPAFIALVIMLLLLRSEEIQRNPESDPVENASCLEVFVVSCIPFIVWICICLIDGDYLACGLTDWNGHYACDNKLHPRCVNWCKPTKLSPGKNETDCYENTLKFFFISQSIGYGLAFSLCVIALICVIYCESRTSACCRSQESQEQQSPGTTSATTGQHESGSSQAGERQEESGGSATAVQEMEMGNLLSDHQHEDS